MGGGAGAPPKMSASSPPGRGVCLDPPPPRTLPKAKMGRNQPGIPRRPPPSDPPPTLDGPVAPPTPERGPPPPSPPPYTPHWCVWWGGLWQYVACRGEAHTNEQA